MNAVRVRATVWSIWSWIVQQTLLSLPTCDELVVPSVTRTAGIAVPVGLAGQEWRCWPREQGAEHAQVDEIRALSGGHLRGRR